jgi:hypothetical protein
MENASHNSTTLNETTQNTTSYSSRYSSRDAVRYSSIAVTVFGICGNTLVIISILRQRRLLRNNYYFLVFHLAICDLVWLLINFFLDINIIFYRNFTLRLFHHNVSFPRYNTFRLSSHRNMYDVDHVSASLSCYCASLEICHQSTEIESRLWFGVHCWFHCGLWTSYAVLFRAVERYPNCLSQKKFCLLHILLLHFPNNIYGCSLL